MTRSVLDWLEAAANHGPDAAAFDMQGESLNWAETHRMALKIGGWIAARVPRQSPILILMEKRPLCVAAMLGAVYAGCFYTPLDSSMPTARLELIIKVLEPALIICEDGREPAIAIKTNNIYYILSEPIETGNQALLLERREMHIDNDLLYVLFTSGSTGIPKGVAITHRSVIDFIQWACEALRLPRGLRFGSQAPFYFDNSVLDIFCAMKQRGSVHIIARMDFMFPKRLLTTLQTQKINTIFWVPSALAALSNAKLLTPGVLPELKRIFFCGEVMPCATLNIWREALPECDYVNMYGPTEITDVCTWYRVNRDFRDSDSLPIGHPCKNTRIYIINGEICVGGTCLSPGYYNNPKKTAEAFIQNPLRPQFPEIIYKTGDMGEYNKYGELMFLGRRDSQIKRNGYRIELGEIECAIQSLPEILLACCYYDNNSENIIAAYTGQGDEKALKAALKALLPKYMLPDILLRREALPRTGSGKLDRLALKMEVESEHIIP